MDHPAYQKMHQLARRPDALEATISYLSEKLSFLKRNERVLICFPQHEPDSIAGVMEQVVRRSDATPVLWEGDLRWKTLLRLAFSSRATTIIGPPLIVLGLSKLAKANGTPLYVRNVVTAGYPCLDWMNDGIIKGLDCNTWRCFNPGTESIVAGFSCSRSAGVHLRDTEYCVDVVDDEGRTLPAGEIGEMVLYPKSNPSLRCPVMGRARWDKSPCPCGCNSPRLVDISMGKNIDKDLVALGEYLQNWASILDCRLQKGPYGLEMEIIIFPGEKLPKLPSCAKQVIRPWDPENDVPFWTIPGREKTEYYAENH